MYNVYNVRFSCIGVGECSFQAMRTVPICVHTWMQSLISVTLKKQVSGEDILLGFHIIICAQGCVCFNTLERHNCSDYTGNIEKKNGHEFVLSFV